MFAFLYTRYETVVKGYISAVNNRKCNDFDLQRTEFEFHFLQAGLPEIQNDMKRAIDVGRNISNMLTRLGLREVVIEAA